jgi:hypothetical protein
MEAPDKRSALALPEECHAPNRPLELYHKPCTLHDIIAGTVTEKTSSPVPPPPWLPCVAAGSDLVLLADAQGRLVHVAVAAALPIEP